MWPRGRNPVPVPANSNWKIMKIIGESFLTRPPGVQQHAYEQKGVKIGGEILFESWSPQICTRFFEKYFEGWTGARSGRRSRGACRGGSEQQVLQGRAQATRAHSCFRPRQFLSPAQKMIGRALHRLCAFYRRDPFPSRGSQ